MVESELICLAARDDCSTEVSVDHQVGAPDIVGSYGYGLGGNRRELGMTGGGAPDRIRHSGHERRARSEYPIHVAVIEVNVHSTRERNEGGVPAGEAPTGRVELKHPSIADEGVELACPAREY